MPIHFEDLAIFVWTIRRTDDFTPCAHTWEEYYVCKPNPDDDIRITATSANLLCPQISLHLATQDSTKWLNLSMPTYMYSSSLAANPTRSFSEPIVSQFIACDFKV